MTRRDAESPTPPDALRPTRRDAARPTRRDAARPTRRDALRPTRRELVAGTAVVAALALAPAAAAADPADLERLERLLALEQRLEAAYQAALDRDAIDRGLGEMLLAHEREHVRALEQVLAALGRRAPQAGVRAPGIGMALASRGAFARFAHELEREAVAAYTDALATLRRDGLLQPLGSIMAAAAQHQVALRQSVGQALLRGVA